MYLSNVETNDTFPKLLNDCNRSTTENGIKTGTLDKYIYWAWIKTIENQVLFANGLVRHSKPAQ